MNQVKKRTVIKKLAPVLMAEDVAAAVKFYEEALDFKRVVTVPDKAPFVFGMVENCGVEIQFVDPKSFADSSENFKDKKPGGTIALYMDTCDIDALYEKVAKWVKIFKDMHKTPYGTREFYILDCNGYILGFAEKQ